MLANRVREFTTTVGAGDITLSGALAGHITFADAFSVGESVIYVIEDGDDYEIGTGTLLAADTLERTIVEETLVGGTLTKTGAVAISLSGGARIYCAATAQFLMRPEVMADVISETTADAGVTVDGVLLKDGLIDADGGTFSGDVNIASGSLGIGGADAIDSGRNFKAATLNVNNDAAIIHADGRAEFSGDVTIGNLTSTGIDDNASSTAISISSSGRVDIGSYMNVDAVYAQSGGTVTGPAFRLAEAEGSADVGLFGSTLAGSEFLGVSVAETEVVRFNQDLSTTFSGNVNTDGKLTVDGGAKISVHNKSAGGSARGIFWFDTDNTDWGSYMAQSGALKALSDGSACTSLDGRTNYHLRSRVADANTAGFIWENNSEECLMSLTADTGDLYTKGNVVALKRLGVGGTTLQGAALATFNTTNSLNRVVIDQTVAGASPTLYLRNAVDSNPATLQFTNNGIQFKNASEAVVATLSGSGIWNFQGNALTGVGNVTMSGTQIVRNGNGSSLAIAGGNEPNVGGSIYLYGSTHGSNANDVDIYSNGSLVARYDASEGHWNYNNTPVIGFGNVGVSGTTISRTSTTSALFLSGGATAASSANIVLYGSAHASRANDMVLRSGGTVERLAWDENSTFWNFHNTTLVNADVIRQTSNAQTTLISGGSGTIDGANITLNGGTTSGTANDILFRADATPVLQYDHSGSLWDFQGNAVTSVSQIARGAADQTLIVSGGPSENAGGRVVLYGSSHATQANNITFFAGAGAVLQWDNSIAAWDFQGNALTGVGGLTLAGSEIHRDIGTSFLRIGGGSDQSEGSSVIFYGESASAAGDILFQSGTNNLLRWDESQDRWECQGKAFTHVGPGDAVSITFGSDNSGSTLTNDTQKWSRIGSAHYTNNEEPLALISGRSDDGDSRVSIGGGTSFMNAATELRFYTAPDATTQTGTERLTIESDGTADFQGNNLSGINILTISNEIRLPDGGPLDPALAFSNDDDLGLYRISASTLGVTANGALQLSISDTEADFQGNNLTDVGDISMSGDEIHRGSATNNLFLSGGTDSFAGANIRLFGESHATNAGDMHIRNDTTAWFQYDSSTNVALFSGTQVRATSYMFSSDSNTGMAPDESETLQLMCNGIRQLVLSQTEANFQDNDITTTGDIKAGGMLNLGTPTELTISSGAITVTKSFHTVDTESDAATDDLETINGGSDGDILVLQNANGARVVTVKDGVDNLHLEGDCVLSARKDKLVLIYDDVLDEWYEISRSNNA